ncbi:hypothetical protein Hdeb2414_s0006g00215441 [Helianthus debilis subsp. tardiflorus]
MFFKNNHRYHWAFRGSRFRPGWVGDRDSAAVLLCCVRTRKAMKRAIFIKNLAYILVYKLRATITLKDFYFS